MNLGRGFPVPQEKQTIQQNGKFWIPATPEKPVVQRPNYPQPEMQQNQTGQENWQDLLGVYTGLLQEEHGNGPPKKPNLHVGPLYREHDIQDVAPVVTCNTLPQNFTANGLVEQSHREPNIRYGVVSPNFRQNGVISPSPHQNGAVLPNLRQNGVVYPNSHQNGVASPNLRQNGVMYPNPHQNGILSSNLCQNGVMFPNPHQNGVVFPNLRQNGVASPILHQKGVISSNFRDHNMKNANMNQKAGSIGYEVHNLGRAMAPRKVNSLAELLGSMNSSPLTNVEPSRNTYITDTCSVSQGFDSNQSTYKSDSALLQQNHILQGNCSIGYYNLPHSTNIRLSVPSRPDYNLNFPPRSEDGESSSALTLLNQLWPATPDQQKQTKNHQIIQEHVSQADKTPNQDKVHDNDIFSLQPEIVEKNRYGSMQTTLGTSISTPSKEKNNFEGGNEVGIDLNKTPPQKTPKRKKHRPKVVKEGKLKKTPKKPAATKVNTPDEKTREKRKYVRRKGIETSKTPLTDVAKEVEVINVEPAAKTCKRSLNFDSEKGVEKESQCRDFDYQEQNNVRNKVPFDLNLDSNNTEWSAEINVPSTLALEENQEIDKEKQIPFEDSVSITVQPPAPKNHTLNVIARNLSFQKANINQSGIENWYDPVHDRLANIAQSGVENLNGRRQMILHSNPQILESSVNITEKEGSQRDNSCTELGRAQSLALMGSQLSSNGISKKDEYMGRSSTVWQKISENIKKSRIEDKVHENLPVSEITTIEDYSVLSKNRGDQSFQAQSSTLCTSTNSEANNVTYDWYFNSADLRYKLQQQNASSEAHQCAEILGDKTSHGPTNMQSAISVTTFTNCNQAKYTQGNEVLQSPVSVPVKSLIEKKSRKKISIGDRVPQKEPENSRVPGNSTNKVKGSRGKKKKIFTVDDITDFLRDLSINDTGKEIVRREQTALVPYIGDRAIVAYEPIKRRLPRPKVDLDPESNRLWNLLMGKEGSETAEAVDADKHKWWEKERKVFRGRVDSFIARMHEVQGDRRFSKWKGSVVDSVIGVFLTQNVSDHLSSSAFMSLAAKFPLKSRTDKPECSQNGEQNQVRVTFPDRTYDHISHLGNGHSRTEEDIISSQSSSESVIYQASEDIRSSSGSNSETEEQLMGRDFNLNHTPANLSAQGTAVFQQHQFPVPEKPLYGQYLGVASGKNVNSHHFTSNGPDLVTPLTGSWLSMLTGPEKCDECMSSLASMDFGSTTETSYTAQQNGRPNYQASLMDLQKESTFLVDPTIPVEVSNTEPSGNVHSYTGLYFDNEANLVAHNLLQSENVIPKPNELGQVHYSEGQSSKISNATQNGRKRKAEKEKVQPFNWDILREQVQSKNGPRGINVNAMDSLDYEALRNADVREISDAIKERGMNNMLAERIKAFLNRLVHDHGRVDLEWLRDVQPDKGKDYLLSIRGLGLKSVECVRLLTLHHLAFPVDTNVGRIAVRLGWVPLQPLPESLQLHLLEMYPVLESIQKYLWPRLCKLDQQTLYELHYQMITFGKVFCTKRGPNCNACPMRGECRHFASAFASARLALPGPEERGIVMSANQTSPKKFSDVTIKPMSLRQSCYNFENEREMGFAGNCEPIIEEPSTPEPPTEVLEREIEDAFYEDPDEIPVIKLNLQEFTTNLQSFMQENMEMQEFDMSRALVALSPELASIPMPKLKHVSRLRTEHQVYELPDSHPLLKGMDRREPDDPSPYLLAIWTPGETADSIQPPQSKCSSLEEGQCNLSTCFACNSAREANSQTVRGTILMPCRTAMRGSFPLNGTYFQVNELFADHESSLNPIDVLRSWLWPLERRTVFFGTSVSTIFKGLSTKDIQVCFWKGFVCVRGFDRETRSPRPLKARLHFPASKLVKQNEQRKSNAAKKV